MVSFSWLDFDGWSLILGFRCLDLAGSLDFARWILVVGFWYVDSYLSMEDGVPRDKSCVNISDHRCHCRSTAHQNPTMRS